MVTSKELRITDTSLSRDLAMYDVGKECTKSAGCVGSLEEAGGGADGFDVCDGGRKLVEEFGRFFGEAEAVLAEEVFCGALWNASVRSLCWKVLFGIVPPEATLWVQSAGQARESYERLRANAELIKRKENEDKGNKMEDLVSPKTLWFEIWKDLERTKLTIEMVGFGHESVKQVMLRILFTWAVENPAVGYRQGMNEILSVVLHVLQAEYSRTTYAFEGMASTPVIIILQAMLDVRFVEHDAFQLLDYILQKLLSIYDASSVDTDDIAINHRHDLRPNTLPSRLEHIQHRLLQRADPELAAFMHSLGVEPYMFLIRWMRVMFSREIPLPQLLLVWDAIFAATPGTLTLIDSICVSLLVQRDFRSILMACEDSSDLLQALKRMPVLMEDQVLQLVHSARELHDSYERSVERMIQQIESAESLPVHGQNSPLSQPSNESLTPKLVVAAESMLTQKSLEAEDDGWLRIDAEDGLQHSSNPLDSQEQMREQMDFQDSAARGNGTRFSSRQTIVSIGHQLRRLPGLLKKSHPNTGKGHQPLRTKSR